jgi:hypothetical protein
LKAQLIPDQPVVDVDALKHRLSALPAQSATDVRLHVFHFMLGALRDEKGGASLTRADVRDLFFKELTDSIADHEPKGGAS